MAFKINESLYKDIKAGTNIISGEEYKEALYTIAQIASDMVSTTLGPYGATTLIDDSMFTYPSKDGWQCLNRLRFGTPEYNTLYKVLKDVSFNIVTRVGDGSTTALVGANIFLHLLLDFLDSEEGKKIRQAEFVDTLAEVQDEIIEKLLASDEVHRIDRDGDFSDIYRVSMISSNGNDKLSRIIQNIYSETHNQNIYITMDRGTELSYEIQKGYKYDATTLNHEIYVNEESGICKLTNQDIRVAVFDHNITYNEHAGMITMLSRYASMHNATIVILAPYIDSIMANIINTNMIAFRQKGQVPNIIIQQIPLTKEINRLYLQDIVLLTNSQLIDYGKARVAYGLINKDKIEEKLEDTLIQAEQYQFDSVEDIFDTCLGSIDTFIIDKSYSIIQGFENVVDKTMYDLRVKEVQDIYLAEKSKAEKSTSVLYPAYMDAHQRYIKFLGAMGVIKVGAGSELAKHCLKDTVDDAVLACKSAYENGYVRGLNLAMIKTISTLLLEEESRTTEDIPATLRHIILKLLRDTFIDTALTVMRNKCDDNYKRTVNLPSDVDIVVDRDSDETSWRSISREEAMENGLTNEAILSVAAYYDYGFNLVTEEFESMDALTVINSVSTDIEVLKAMNNILTLMLTSSQFISENRQFDRKLGTQQILETKINERKVLTKATIDAFKENGGLEILTKTNLT